MAPILTIDTALIRSALGLSGMVASIPVADLVGEELTGDELGDQMKLCMGLMLEVRLRGYRSDQLTPAFFAEQSQAAKNDARILFGHNDGQAMPGENLKAAIRPEEVHGTFLPDAVEAGTSDPASRALIRLAIDYALLHRAFFGRPIPSTHESYLEALTHARDDFARWILEGYIPGGEFSAVGPANLVLYADAILADIANTAEEDLLSYITYFSERFDVSLASQEQDLIAVLLASTIDESRADGDPKGIITCITEAGYSDLTMLSLAVLLYNIRTKRRPSADAWTSRIGSIADTFSFLGGNCERARSPEIEFCDIPKNADGTFEPSSMRAYLEDHVRYAVLAVIISEQRLGIPIALLKRVTPALVTNITNRLSGAIGTENISLVSSGGIYKAAASETRDTIAHIWPKHAVHSAA